MAKIEKEKLQELLNRAKKSKDNQENTKPDKIEKQKTITNNKKRYNYD